MESILALDKAIIFWVQTNLVPGGPDSLMIALSAIGAKGAIWILIALVLLFTKKYRRTGAAMLIGLVLALIVGDMLLKAITTSFTSSSLITCLRYQNTFFTQ